MKIIKTKYNSICFFQEDKLFEEFKIQSSFIPAKECIEFIIDESGLYNQIHWWLTYKFLRKPAFFVRINKKIKLIKVCFHSTYAYCEENLIETYELLFLENIDAISKMIPKLNIECFKKK